MESVIGIIIFLALTAGAVWIGWLTLLYIVLPVLEVLLYIVLVVFKGLLVILVIIFDALFGWLLD